jgi:hypothetical protein
MTVRKKEKVPAFRCRSCKNLYRENVSLKKMRDDIEKEFKVETTKRGTLQMKVEVLTARLNKILDKDWTLAALERYKGLYTNANDTIAMLQVDVRKLQAEVSRQQRGANKQRAKR